MKRIVVATDFSPASRKAFSFGVKLARQLKAEVIAVYVMNTTDLRFALREQVPNIMEGTSKELKARVMALVEAQFKKMLRQSGQSYQRIRTLCVRGNPAEEIARIAGKVSAEMIVVGTRSRGSVVALVLGSTARDLIQRAVCPVVTLRENTRLRVDRAKPSVRVGTQ